MTIIYETPHGQRVKVTKPLYPWWRITTGWYTGWEQLWRFRRGGAP